MDIKYCENKTFLFKFLANDGLYNKYPTMI